MKNNFWVWAIVLVVLVIGVGMSAKGILSKVFSNKYDELFTKWGKVLGLDPRHLKAVAATESRVGLDTRYEPIGKTQGIMHVTIIAAREVMPTLTQAQFDNLLNTPELDIELGSKFFKKKWDDFKQYSPEKRLEYAIKAYNGGTGRMNQILAGQSSPVINSAKNNMQIHWDRYTKNLKTIGVA